ncbi:uncharacterized protein FA14DRAFT_79184 [Meira miltonrushii]|uniref:Uncharacterized protein n=1 Tax=Meira miltonrushii TaxID=1280837 RepID=A0A316VBE4_9BASI|nr:uncharacterized protein FA14DRAFT_79184 [Meira miltonrushii]PWN32895.1 hypothetical protein FA14DRAFT_79184 [Meira miltonrushii]
MNFLALIIYVCAPACMHATLSLIGKSVIKLGKMENVLIRADFSVTCWRFFTPPIKSRIA